MSFGWREITKWVEEFMELARMRELARRPRARKYRTISKLTMPSYLRAVLRPKFPTLKTCAARDAVCFWLVMTPIFHESKKGPEVIAELRHCDLRQHMEELQLSTRYANSDVPWGAAHLLAGDDVVLLLPLLTND